MSASADVETNINGLVVIHYLTKLDWSKLDRRGIWQIAKFQQCLPYKFRAAHICDTHTNGAKFYQTIFIKTLDAISRVRILYHPGEYQQKQSHGIFGRDPYPHFFSCFPIQGLIWKLPTSSPHLAYRSECCHWTRTGCQQ